MAAEPFLTMPMPRPGQNRPSSEDFLRYNADYLKQAPPTAALDGMTCPSCLAELVAPSPDLIHAEGCPLAEALDATMIEDRAWGAAHPDKILRRRPATHAEVVPIMSGECQDARHYETVVLYTDDPAVRFRSVDHTASPHGRPGRNEPCPCGSGRKFKFCHGAR